MILYSRHSEIRLTIEPLIPVNAFIEERVRIMRARRVRRIEELDYYDVYSPFQ